MSLTSAQRRQTSTDLAENLRRSGIPRGTVETDLGWTRERFDATLAVGSDVSPVDVWALRDYLDAALREDPDEAARWTVLTDRARTAATAWFPLD
ncbi:DUF2316 family protein [Sinomonas sp. ASV486]|uniref:DUF2316 family protein n=1 Tax=Sinomonas puerhi TaxID=3238584 RepID=A0AB39L5Z3_9MICC|nr:DUF2316 family protein [Sinomonas sp. ASV486]MDQ4490200.1 DUF2316 family protein [Sinomonas sp. ASV486]